MNKLATHQLHSVNCLIFKPGVHQLQAQVPGFLDLLVSVNVCMLACVCVAPEAINNQWHDVV